LPRLPLVEPAICKTAIALCNFAAIDFRDFSRDCALLASASAGPCLGALLALEGSRNRARIRRQARSAAKTRKDTAMNRMQQIPVNATRETRIIGIADFYPWAGIIGIAAYIFAECFLE
jgi:hypothetical protein